MRFAVGYMNFFDNELKVEIVEADNWKGALLAHSGLSEYRKANEEMVAGLSDDQEEARDEAFGMDWAFEVTVIP